MPLEMLVVCCYCHRLIRRLPLEESDRHLHGMFSHGVCKSCRHLMCKDAGLTKNDCADCDDCDCDKKGGSDEEAAVPAGESDDDNQGRD